MKLVFRTKIMRFGDVYAIPLDFDFMLRTGLNLGSELVIRAEEIGEFSMTLTSQAPNAVCPICGIDVGLYKCVSCGRFVCKRCYWEPGGLCVDCMKK